MAMRKKRGMSRIKSNLRTGAVSRSRAGMAMFACNENEVTGANPIPMIGRLKQLGAVNTTSRGQLSKEIM